MSVVPGGLETDQQPPMAVPLAHFAVGLGFLLVGVVVGLLAAVGPTSGSAGLAHVHLLFAGWVCLTILGAMTQFVPVWSGVALHSRRLAITQLWLVTTGLVGFATTLLWGDLTWLPAFGVLLVAGFWTFVYNLGRTLAAARPLDVTERHFALTLGFFVVVTTLGFLLAVDFTTPVFGRFGVSRSGVIGAHATLAVFGAILTTVFGALYQLATMFTQSQLHGIDYRLQRIEEFGFPVGVLALAGGRLFEHAPLATAGGLLVALGVLAFAAILARRLVEVTVERTPMLSRYAVVAPSMAIWAVTAGIAWLADPLAPATRFGPSGASHLLAFGVIGFVVLGTLYHVVPFVIWIHRYSDRLGYEPVPMIDDLYDARIARVDFVALLVGTVLLVAGETLGASLAFLAGGITATVGIALFAVNMLLVVRRHSPYGLLELLSASGGGEDRADPELGHRQN